MEKYINKYKEEVCNYCCGKCEKGIRISENKGKITLYCDEYLKDVAKLKEADKYIDPIVTKRYEKYVARKRGDPI